MKNKLYIVFFIFILGCKDNEGRKDQKFSTDIKIIENLIDLEGNLFDVSKLKGKKILVNYWATWCAPCIKEMPDLLEAQEILSKENYAFLLVSDESEEQILNFKNKFPYDFTFLISSKAVSSFGVYVMPTTFVFNENGKKVKEIIGVSNWNSEEMITQLKEL
jgi:thiol-disulfide isomerase/thioredoxin